MWLPQIRRLLRDVSTILKRLPRWSQLVTAGWEEQVPPPCGLGNGTEAWTGWVTRSGIVRVPRGDVLFQTNSNTIKSCITKKFNHKQIQLSCREPPVVVPFKDSSAVDLNGSRFSEFKAPWKQNPTSSLIPNQQPAEADVLVFQMWHLTTFSSSFFLGLVRGLLFVTRGQA